MKTAQRLVSKSITFATAILCAAATVLLSAAASHAQFYAPGVDVMGRPPLAWAEDYNEWITAFPAALGHPADEPTGALQSYDNNRSVYFLAGGASADRVINVPEGRPLLLMVGNYGYIRTPEAVDVNDVPVWASGNAIDGIRPALPAFIENFVTVGANAEEGSTIHFDQWSLDQSSMDAYRISGFFTHEITVAGNFLGEPTGAWSDSYLDGRAVFFQPPSIGEHLLRFNSSNPLTGLSQNVTARINVVPEPSTALLFVVGLSLFQMRRRRHHRQRLT